MSSETTPNLILPYIAAAQAQKHVTHNEAIRALDAIVQLAVLDRGLAVPPTDPADGDRYIVGSAPSGAWTGQTGKIAAWQDGAWMVYPPREGWVAWVADEDILVAWNGTAWVTAGGGPTTTLNPATGGRVGVNATADATNRLAVASPASLFNHEGAGHQIKVNKNLVADTASVLFQTGFSGRAEFGLAGNDDWSVKVSANGTTWTDAIKVNRSTGEAAFKLQAFDAGVTNRVTDYKTNGSLRWRMGTGANAETGSNAGSPWFVQAFSDTGTYLGMPILCDRATASLKLPWIDFPATGPVFYRPAKPAVDNSQSCGEAAARWTVVYAATGTINTSDERLKTDIVDCPLGLDFIRALSPKLYRWKSGGNEVEMAPTLMPVEETVDGVTRTVEGGMPQGEVLSVTAKPGRRHHAGLLAQDVKAVLDAVGVDCGMWVLDDKNDPSSTQSLRYEQMIAPLIQAVKELAERLDRIERSPAG